MFKRISLLPLAVSSLLLSSLCGCANLGYYAQSVRGHLDLMSRTRPLADVLADPSVPAPRRERLALARDLRGFAIARLGLPENGSYTHYADLGRPRVVWNVTTTDEFSVHPDRSCFVVVGCLNYRGYFDRADAKAHAERLREQGKDVYVSGATAYSTLGWFKDPLLNTMIDRPEPDLADVIFHELAHQKLYIPGDSGFNEAFATAVADHGVRRWYEAHADEQTYRAWARSNERRAEFNRLLARTRANLEAIYARELPVEEKRAAKRAEFAAMKLAYAELKSSWGGYDGYDAFMARDLNNAHLALIATYNELVPAFLALIERNGGDLAAFYAEAARIGRLHPGARRSRLLALLPQTAPPSLNVAGR